MKTIKIFYAVLTGAILLVLAACNKGEDDFFHSGDIVTVNFKGYNASDEELEVKIDTTKMKSPLKSNSDISENTLYTFYGNQSEAKLTITEKSTGKLVLEREVKKDEKNVTVNLFYMDGKVSEMPEKPAVEKGKNKVIYMFKPTLTNYTGLVDIEAVKVDNLSGGALMERIGRINNVKPNEFTTEPLIFPTFKTGAQEINGVRVSPALYIRIYKAGTNEYYTNGTGYTWHENSTSPAKNAAATASSRMYIIEEVSYDGTQMSFQTVFQQL